MKLRLLTGIYLLGMLSACGGGSGGDAPPGVVTDKVVAAVSISDGDNQTATVGTSLPSPLVALVKNQAGQPIPGQVVNFVVTQGGGALFAATVTTDENGFATEVWTLGPTSGVNKVEVRANDASGVPVVRATFTANAVAGAPQSAGFTNSPSQSSIQLQPYASPIRVVVRDANGNLVPGISVTFTASSGGSTSPGTAVTDASGAATTSWTLGGPLGEQTVTASVPGLQPITYRITAIAAPIAKLSGDQQSVPQYIPVPLPLEVIAKDALGNPVAGAQVTFAATTSTAIAVTDIDGKASWTCPGNFHTIGPQAITATLDGNTVTFNVTVVATAHTYDGSYNCAAPSPLDSFTMSVINGLVANPNNSPGPWVYSGTLNETTGALSAEIRPSLSISYGLTGQMAVDLAQLATGSGTATNSTGDPAGAWTCIRQ